MRRYCRFLRVVALCALHVAPTYMYASDDDIGPRPPANPWLGLDGSSTIHNDGSASDTTDFEGPGVGTIQPPQNSFVPLIANCAVALILQSGNPILLCLDFKLFPILRPVVRILDRDSASVLKTLLLEGEIDPLASSYAYLTNEDQLVLAGGSDSLIRIQTMNETGEFDLQVIDTIDLSDHIPDEHSIIAMNPSVDGAIWVVTNLGAILRHDPDRGRTASIKLEGGELISNSLASSGDGKVAVASDRALYLFKAGNKGRKIKKLWRQEYDEGPARKPGKLSQGTGSSPTFFGPKKGNEYVTIADNHAGSDRILIFETKKKRNPLVCTVEPEGNSTFASESSPIGIGNSVVYASTYGYPYPLPVLSQLPPSDPPTEPPLQGGVLRVDVKDAKDKDCEIVWHNEEVKSSAVPKLSVSDELIYTFERFDGPPVDLQTYFYSAIDFHTGNILTRQPVGQFSTPRNVSAPFDTLGLAGNIGFDRVLYQGTAAGLFRIAPVPN